MKKKKIAQIKNSFLITIFFYTNKKVELGVIKNWVAKKVTEILGVEDEVIINLVITELES